MERKAFETLDAGELDVLDRANREDAERGDVAKNFELFWRCDSLHRAIDWFTSANACP